MSLWSGLVAAGIGVALGIVALGLPVWEYHRVDSSEEEFWRYGAFTAGNTVYNDTTGVTTYRNYTYNQLATLPPGRDQPNMARVFGEFAQFVLLGLTAAGAGIVLTACSRWKNLRGVYAGIAFLVACGSIFYACFTIAFALPEAATYDLRRDIPIFSGGTVGGLPRESWSPAFGWFIPIASGLALAWSSSDLWHLKPGRQPLPMKVEVTLRRAEPKAVAATAPSPVDPAPAPVREPVIEEVFVIGANGLLIKHMSRSLMTDKDRDVVGSMISAISSFVREAFTERDGEVHEVSLGDHRFVMCTDRGLVLAVLVTSGETEDLIPRLRGLLSVLGDRYGERLSRYQGEPLEGIEDELGVLWHPYHLPPPPTE